MSSKPIKGNPKFSINSVDTSYLGNKTKPSSFNTPFKSPFYIHGENGPINIWGGSEYMIDRRPFDPDLLIQANDLNTFNPSHANVSLVVNQEAKDFFKGGENFLHPGFPHLILDWPDMGIPRVNRKWWEYLSEKIVNLPSNSDVFFSCTGGTGRTGTMMCIILGLLTSEKNPVTFVRKNYRESAVETREQLDYIQKITGLTIEEDVPMDSWWLTYGKNMGFKKGVSDDEEDNSESLYEKDTTSFHLPNEFGDDPNSFGNSDDGDYVYLSDGSRIKVG